MGGAAGAELGAAWAATGVAEVNMFPIVGGAVGPGAGPDAAWAAIGTAVVNMLLVGVEMSKFSGRVVGVGEQVTAEDNQVPPGVCAVES